jgi:hypothetical protein
MLWLAAAAIAASLPSAAPQPAGTPAVQARATVRIVSGVRVQFGAALSIEGSVLRRSTIQTADGSQKATLVEFQ